MPDPRHSPGHEAKRASAEAVIAWAARLLRMTEIPAKPYEARVTLAGENVPDSAFYLGSVQLDGSTDYMIGVNIRQAIVKTELITLAVGCPDDEFEELCRRADEPPIPDQVGPKPSQLLRDWRAGYLKFKTSPAAAALRRQIERQYGGPVDALEEILRDMGLDDPGEAA